MRDITGLTSSLSAAEIQPFFAVDLLFDTATATYNGSEIAIGPLYLWTGVGEIEIDGNTYTGAGSFLSISEIKETADISAAGVTLGLSGLPPSLISLALVAQYSGRICKIRFGVQGSPNIITMLFIGYMDEMNISEGSETTTISIAVESKLIDLDRPRIQRYTSESQKSRYAGDLAFDFIPDLQDKPLSWGRKA
mgnify:CR=1 FL=1|tara:strand:+ start:328 stop:909 length:582 start_codon:yes stop_codon:yes gene_type:complete